jgi:hypothetical protein
LLQLLLFLLQASEELAFQAEPLNHNGDWHKNSLRAQQLFQQVQQYFEYHLTKNFKIWIKCTQKK